jgi:hypothetical protein
VLDNDLIGCPLRRRACREVPKGGCDAVAAPLDPFNLVIEGRG